MQVKLSEQISSADAEIISKQLTDWIQDALVAPAAEIDYSVEAIIEMAIASFLDTEALSFADCKPGRGI
jgi:predicted transcriptional regulator